MKVFSAFLLVVLALIATSAQDQPTIWTSTSLIQILSSPERHNGKRVRISGFLHHRFEDNAIYFSKDDADFLITENALWVSFADKPKLEALCADDFRAANSSLGYFDGRFVFVEGIVVARNRGHLGMFAAGLEKITRIAEQRRWYDGRDELIKRDKDGRLQVNCEKSNR